jgi:hypothetical protein
MFILAFIDLVLKLSLFTFTLGACDNGTAYAFISYGANPCSPLQKPINTRLPENGIASPSDPNILKPDVQGLCTTM